MKTSAAAPNETLLGRWNLARSILTNHRPSESSVRMAIAALEGRRVEEILAIAKELRGVA